MRCNQTQSLLDDYLDHQTDDELAAEIALHVQGCESCQAELETRTSLRQLLEQLPVDQPAEGFFESLVDHAAAKADRREPVFRKVWVSTAIAAAFAAVFFTATLLGPDSSKVPAAANGHVTLAANTVTPVKLMFSSASLLEDARLSIQLPVGVELAGHNGLSDLSWTTDLEPGKNILRLPLVGRIPISDELVAQLDHPSGTKTFRLQITVNQVE